MILETIQKMFGNNPELITSLFIVGSFLAIVFKNGTIISLLFPTRKHKIEELSLAMETLEKLNNPGLLALTKKKLSYEIYRMDFGLNLNHRDFESLNQIWILAQNKLEFDEFKELTRNFFTRGKFQFKKSAYFIALSLHLLIIFCWLLIQFVVADLFFADKTLILIPLQLLSFGFLIMVANFWRSFSLAWSKKELLIEILEDLEKENSESDINPLSKADEPRELVPINWS